MDRNARALILALLCVLAVSLGAATLVNPQSPGGGGNAGGDAIVEPGGNEEPDNEGIDEDTDTSQQEVFSLNGICIPFLLSPQFILLATVFLALLVVALKRRRTLAYAFAIVFPMVMFATPLWLLVTNCGDSVAKPGGDPMAAVPEGTPDVPSAGPGGQAGGTEQLFSPPAIVALLVVVALVLAVLVYRASGDDTSEEPDGPTPVPEPPGEEAALAAVGEVAGAAADRIEAAADVDNEVYRAWREMTTHVDVRNPDSSTPREFAMAASEAGMSEDHVETLTALFRDVRYGGREVTEDRERRAVDALRAIEAEYADGGDR